MDKPDISGTAAGRRLRRVGEICLWALVIGATVVAALWLASKLRLVILPVLLAIVLATFLAPPARWLRNAGLPPAAASVTVIALALLALAGIGLWVVPQFVDQASNVDVELTEVVDRAQEWVAESPLPFSSQEVADAIDRGEEALRNNVSDIASGAISGALLVFEVLVGLILAIAVLFFLLKDGERIWAWVVSLAPVHKRGHVGALGERAWGSLAGFVRGQTAVALIDAIFIGLALVLLDVPLALPLAVLIFFGAYIPIIGAFVTGFLAVMVALVAQGLVTALLTLAAIVAVQQIEGNVLQPFLVGRAVHVHPLAILLGVTAGAALAGIIGAMLAAPVVAVGGAALTYLREQAEPG